MTAPPTTRLRLEDIRPAAAAALQPGPDDDLTVLEDIVDSLTPPAIMLGWGDPWITPQVPGGVRVMGPCIYTARLLLVLSVARLEPGVGVDELERLAAYAITRLTPDVFGVIEQVTSPIQRDQGGVASIESQITYAVSTSIQEFTPEPPPGEQLDETAFGDLAPDSSVVGSYGVGVRLRFEAPRRITALRFYRAAGVAENTRKLYLWTPTGDKLAETTSTGETGTGWKAVDLTAPYDVPAAGEVVVSYDCPSGFEYLNGPPVSINPAITAVAGRYVSGSGYPDTAAPVNYMADVVCHEP